MRGYGQFCPVAVASELFAQRWTPLILRELLAGSRRFNQIQRGLPRISRTLLAQRLRELERAGALECVAADGGGREYRLTPAGAELQPVIWALGVWGQRWTTRVDEQNLDAGLLMWSLRRTLAADRLPGRRIVVELDFHGLPPRHRRPHVFWLILDRPEVDLCVEDPGSEVDLYVSADLRSFARVLLGDLPFTEALASGAVEFTGRRELVRAFPSWLLLSPFARVPRPPAPAYPTGPHAGDARGADASGTR
jgi:DNA-binding HxlR family transcriptional regulator